MQRDRHSGFKSGDVIGITIELPPLKEQKQAIESFINQKLREKNTQSNDNHPSKKKRKTKKNSEINNDDEKYTKYDNVQRDKEIQSIIKMHYIMNNMNILLQRKWIIC